MIIGIDHGNANIKTSTGFKCVSGFTNLNDESITNKGLLMYNSRYYSVGSERLPLKMDKTKDEDFFILTLGAIGEILKVQGSVYSTDNIVLGVGLPIVNYGKLKGEFRDYFIRDKILFNYEGKNYDISIKDCIVFPQGYSALLTRFQDYKGSPICNVVDIGGGTVDFFWCENGILNISSCSSLQLGAINLFNKIIQQTTALGYRISEFQIEQILSGERPIFENDEIYQIIENTTRDFARNLISKLQENGLEMSLNPTVFIGGGSILLKRYIEESRIGYIEVIEDEFANAKGFEMLAKQKLQNR